MQNLVKILNNVQKAIEQYSHIEDAILNDLDESVKREFDSKSTDWTWFTCHCVCLFLFHYFTRSSFLCTLLMTFIEQQTLFLSLSVCVSCVFVDHIHSHKCQCLPLQFICALCFFSLSNKNVPSQNHSSDSLSLPDISSCNDTQHLFGCSFVRFLSLLFSCIRWSLVSVSVFFPKGVISLPATAPFLSRWKRKLFSSLSLSCPLISWLLTWCAMTHQYQWNDPELLLHLQINWIAQEMTKNIY